MSNRKIINFPGASCNDKMKSEEILNLSGLSFYNDIEFETAKDKDDFRESLSLFFAFIDRDGEDINLLKEAIELSKYNVEARSFEILISDMKEYEKEKAFKDLMEETKYFDVERYDIGFEVNVFEYRVRNYLAEFYMQNKLYSRVLFDAYEIFTFIEDNEFLMEMYRKRLVASLFLNNFNFYENQYNLLTGDLRDDEVIIISKVFYHILRQEEVEAIAYFDKLSTKNKYFKIYLEKILDPDKEMGKISKSDSFKFFNIVKAFSLFDELFQRPYFFDFIMELVNSDSLSKGTINRYLKKEETTVIDMLHDPIFDDIGMNQIRTLWENALVDEESFLDVYEEEVLGLPGIGKGTIKKLENNGVIFKDWEEHDEF